MAVPPFTLREVAAVENGFPAHFVLDVQQGVTPTPEQVALAESVTKAIARICAETDRDHPKRGEWLALLRGLATEGLAAGQPDAAVRARLEALTQEIARDLARFRSAPFHVSADLATHSLHIAGVDGAAQPSMDQEAFLRELHEAEHFLVTLYRPALGITAPIQERNVVYTRLAAAGQMALGRAHPSLAVARTALAGVLRDAIRDRGPAVRKAYLDGLYYSYVRALAFVFAILFVAHVVTHPAIYFNCSAISSQGCWDVPAVLRPTSERLLLLGVALLAVAFGAWLSAAQRLDTNSPELLGAMLAEGNPTVVRADMVVGFGLVALVMLHTGLVSFAVGTDATPVFTTNNALRSLVAAGLTGAFLGLGERALPSAVNQRAADFVASLGVRAG